MQVSKLERNYIMSNYPDVAYNEQHKLQSIISYNGGLTYGHIISKGGATLCEVVIDRNVSAEVLMEAFLTQHMFDNDIHSAIHSLS